MYSKNKSIIANSEQIIIMLEHIEKDSSLDVMPPPVKEIKYFLRGRLNQTRAIEGPFSLTSEPQKVI